MKPQDQLVEILHDLTRMGMQVTFESDFNGMICVSYSNGNHVHLGTPDGDMKQLTVAIVRELAATLEELNE